MSEELLQTAPVPIGRYTYYRLGASTIGQLSQAGIVAGTPPKHIITNKPDGLILLGKGAVKATIEYKPPAQLNSTAKVQRAINQAIEYAKCLCNLLIISDGQQTYWVNPQTGNELIADSTLPVFNAKMIVDRSATVEYLREIENVIDQAGHSLNSSSDVLRSPALVDPSNLARTIWQKIWINTGKEPEKCLYNVVELFVFKFLSDLSVLAPHNNFARVCEVAESAGNEAALTNYAKLSRPAIRELFPDGQDGTGIINGTIFVNEKGEPNNSQARLFCEVLNDLRDYDQEHGSFRYIDKEFKTRLYESFLRQGAGLHHLGQFFTPRNIVQAMVGMSDANTLPPNASMCDPFCGVGGFLLEAILQCPRLMACFKPQNGVIAPDVAFVGYDRGSDEKEDERTIVLAKANALIYFSDLIANYNTAEFAKEFADKVVNTMFQLLRTNLGTFDIDDESRHDLILTNPPYVTRGSGSLKSAIQEAGLGERYSASGRGTESLALQWIVRSLKPGGMALAIVPDGLLNQKPMLEFVKKNCIVKSVVSLPVRTFYATPKKTYILAISRKTERADNQSDAIFAYLVSETGETRDANRWTISENDLDEAVDLYNQFKGSPNSFVSPSSRCKVVTWDEFSAFDHWMLDRLCWDPNELQRLRAVEEPEEPVSIDEFNELLSSVGARPVESLSSEASGFEFAEVFLGDDTLFSLQIGKRVLKKDCVDDGIPCISANVRDVFGYIPDSSLLDDFDRPSLTWGIDGKFDWFFVPADFRFHPTDHCGVLRVLDETIDVEYLYCALRATRDRHGFDRTYRAKLANVGRVSVQIPVHTDRSFDIECQRTIAKTCRNVEESRERAIIRLRHVADASVSIGW